MFPKFKGRASFFFDDNKNDDWITVLNKVIKCWQDKDKRIGEYASVKMKEERGIPCQAADLFAYVQRQQLQTDFDTDKVQPSRLLDLIISRNAFSKNDPRNRLALLPESKWRDLIRTLREYKRKMDATNEIMGTPKQPYSLFEHPALGGLFTQSEIRTMLRLSKSAKLSRQQSDNP